MKTMKYSRQRESIKNFLSTRKDHPTADAVYMNIRKEYPNISLGTVYRNLSLLASVGEIQKISCGDGVDHFDPNADPHYHFVCRDCGAVKADSERNCARPGAASVPYKGSRFPEEAGQEACIPPPLSAFLHF